MGNSILKSKILMSLDSKRARSTAIREIDRKTSHGDLCFDRPIGKQLISYKNWRQGPLM